MRRRHSRMGQYIIKQKLFAIRDKFMIKDTEGNPRFLCHGSLLKIRQTFWLETPSGAPLFTAKRKLFTFLPKFDIYDAQDEKIATLDVKLSAFVKKIKVESERYGSFFIRGGVVAWDFTIFSGEDEDGVVCAQISKRIFNVRDAYNVDIYSGKESFIMTLCIIIDALYHKAK